VLQLTPQVEALLAAVSAQQACPMATSLLNFFQSSSDGNKTALPLDRKLLYKKEVQLQALLRENVVHRMGGDTCRFYKSLSKRQLRKQQEN
jgi:hypothetical protein